ncbi:MAG: alanine--tRNA ligase [Pseudomonadota bacterium]
MTSLNEIRRTFLDYFARHDHPVIQSAPLVPHNDPSLMFVNSGMVPFKNLFTGLETRDYVRATSCQKCVRAGGKHNDLDNVGYTARHHTFFEMLGNFSFGDYFKDVAIPHAWELITKGFDVAADRLYVTVYHTDDEAAAIWKKVGVPDSRIIRIATDDNFWMMGPTGPCGPSSEIFFDHGPQVWGGPPGSAEEDGDRFIEIWNLVFMQFEQFEDGSRAPLPKPSIDTGMGLERIGATLMGSHDNYDTDVMRDLIEASAQATGVDPFGDRNVHHRVIADHLRSTAFLIADGVLPSNEGRGYVLRRIMRRAMRHAHLLGAQDPVMYRLVPTLVRQMGQAYPELTSGQALIEESLLLEETRFKKTLDRGLSLLDAELEALDEGVPLPGAAAFKLYDTYGFPLDLTQDALRERGREVDMDGFEAAMAAQKAQARAAWAGSGEQADAAVWFDIADTHGATDFLGYAQEVAEATVLAIVDDGSSLEAIEEGGSGWVVLNQTPFYGEAGGQVGDKGQVRIAQGDDVSVTGFISDTQKFAGGAVIAHRFTPDHGRLTVGDSVHVTVDHARRTAIRANHSATHLMHEALRVALGDHVAQRGSLNAEDRLRFDFSHTKAMAAGEIAAVEDAVNAFIRQNSVVETRVMTPDEARALGAQALFGEKYGDEVRVVAMGHAPGTGKGADGKTYSLELCGGTHVARTGEIGLFTILTESASAAGVRRIEALTGDAALAHIRLQDRALAEVADALKAPRQEAAARARALITERRELQAELADLRRQVALGGGGQAQLQSEDIGGVAFFAQALSGVSGKDLRGLIDEQKARLGSGVALLIADTGGKAAIAAGVTEDLTPRVSAVDLVRIAAEAMGGRGGGGRPDMAQGGAPDPGESDAAIAAARALLQAAAAA